MTLIQSLLLFLLDSTGQSSISKTIKSVRKYMTSSLKIMLKMVTVCLDSTIQLNSCSGLLLHLDIKRTGYSESEEERRISYSDLSLVFQ